MNNQTPEPSDRASFQAEEEIVEIDLKQLINLILKRWYLIIGLTVLAVVLAGVFSHLQDPVYESSGQIIVEQETGMGGDFMFSAPLQGGGDNMANRLQIIRSPLVIKRAKELLLDRGQEEAAAYLSDRALNGGIIQTSNLGDTDIIEISIQGWTPQEARNLTQAVADAYQDYRESRAQEQSRRVLSFLEEQVARAEEDVEAAEEEVRNFQQTEGVISLDDEATKINEQLSGLENRLVSADITLRESEFRLQNVRRELEELRAQLPEESVSVTGSLLENLRTQLAELEAERIDYINRGLDEDSPEVQSLDSRIQNLEASIRDFSRQLAERPERAGEGINRYNELLGERASLEAEIVGREQEMEYIQEKIAEYEEELTELSDKAFQMSRLQRDVEIAQNTYSLLSEELEKSRISVEREMSDVRIVQEARLPEAPVSPRTMLNLFIAGFLGVFSGTGLVFLLEYLDDTIKEEEELQQLTDLPVLGVIPDIEKVNHKQKNYDGSGQNSEE